MQIRLTPAAAKQITKEAKALSRSPTQHVNFRLASMWLEEEAAAYLKKHQDKQEREFAAKKRKRNRR